MGKKILYSFTIVAMVGVTMWALTIGYLGINNQNVGSIEASSDGNWGLSFQVEGQSPIGNQTPEYLKEYNAYYIDTEGAKDKKIYLTFDAGYENGYTEKILDVLKEQEVSAAFFLVGDYVESNPEIVKRMDEEGHIVGNHTMTHPDMAVITDKEDFQKEIKDLELLYQEATGHTMKKVYRPPQGKYSEENLKLAKEMGYTTIFWSLAYVDWYVDNQPTREDALNTLNSRIHDGAIVLLHSTSKTNCEILEELIKGWKKRGYSFQSIDKLIA